MGRSFVAIHCCYLASRMLGAPSPCRGVWFEEPSAVIPQARVCEGGGQPRYGDPKSGTKLETADTDKVTLPRCCILLYSENLLKEWSAPRELESFRHKLSTGRSAGFMFEIAASNSVGGT